MLLVRWMMLDLPVILKLETIFKMFLTVLACGGGTISALHLEVAQVTALKASHLFFIVCHQNFSHSFTDCQGYHVFCSCETSIGFHHLLHGGFRVWREHSYHFLAFSIGIRSRKFTEQLLSSLWAVKLLINSVFESVYEFYKCFIRILVNIREALLWSGTIWCLK